MDECAGLSGGPASMAANDRRLALDFGTLSAEFT
jgi:hypothetical protein